MGRVIQTLAVEGEWPKKPPVDSGLLIGKDSGSKVCRYP